MQELAAFLRDSPRLVQINFSDKKWHINGSIPNEPGWYFIRTDAPVDVLVQQRLWSETYRQSITGRLARVKNYRIGDRAARYDPQCPRFWNIEEVYSGLAKSLRDRAREHTFADPGTGGLALSKYPELADYSWTFGFFKLRDHILNGQSEWIALRIGEQIWRSKNGWPLLCAA